MEFLVITNNKLALVPDIFGGYKMNLYKKAEHEAPGMTAFDTRVKMSI